MKSVGSGHRLGAISDYSQGHSNSHKLMNQRSISISSPKVVISSGYPEPCSSLTSTRLVNYDSDSQDEKTQPSKRHCPSTNHGERQDHESKGVEPQSKCDSQRSTKHRKTQRVKVIPFKNVVLGKQQDKHVNMYVLNCVSNTGFEELSRAFEEQAIDFYNLWKGQYLVVVEVINHYADTRCASLLEKYGFEPYVSSRFYVHDPMKFYAKIDRQFMRYACRPMKWFYFLKNFGSDFSTSLENEELCIRGDSTDFICGLKSTLPFGIRNGKCYIESDITKDFEKHNGPVRKNIRSNPRLSESVDKTIEKDTCLFGTVKRSGRDKEQVIDDIGHGERNDGGIEACNSKDDYYDDDYDTDCDCCNGVVRADNDTSDKTTNRCKPAVSEVISDDEAVVVDDVVNNAEDGDNEGNDDVEVLTHRLNNRTSKSNIPIQIPISVPKRKISSLQENRSTVNRKTIASTDLCTEDIPSHFVFIDYEISNGTGQKRNTRNVAPTVDQLSGAFSHKLHSIGSRYLKIHVNGQYPQRVCFLMKSKSDILKAWKEMHSHIYGNGVVLLTLCDEQVANDFCYNGKPWNCVEELE